MESYGSLYSSCFVLVYYHPWLRVILYSSSLNLRIKDKYLFPVTSWHLSRSKGDSQAEGLINKILITLEKEPHNFYNDQLPLKESLSTHAYPTYKIKGRVFMLPYCPAVSTLWILDAFETIFDNKYLINIECFKWQTLLDVSVIVVKSRLWFVLITV